MKTTLRRMPLCKMPSVVAALFKNTSVVPVAVIMEFADGSTLRYEVKP